MKIKAQEPKAKPVSWKGWISRGTYANSLFIDREEVMCLSYHGSTLEKAKAMRDRIRRTLTPGHPLLSEPPDTHWSHVRITVIPELPTRRDRKGKR